MKETQHKQQQPLTMSNYVYYEEGVTQAEINEALLEIEAMSSKDIDLALFEALVTYEKDRRRLQDKN
jgi:DNA-binding transcriptional regulator LsrR (DeoR family)